MSDDILARLRAREADAEKELRAMCFSKLEGVCRRAMRDRVEAREVAEDVWTDFLVGPARSVRSAAAIPAYLRLMAVRRCARLRSMQARQESVDEDAASPATPESTLMEAGEQRMKAFALARCLRRLQPRMRRVLRMRFHHDLTQEAIGEEIGVSKQYVGRMLAKSFEALRACMEAGA